MNGSIAVSIRLYTLLIHLYPREFRDEFQDELTGVFLAMLREAGQQSTFALLKTALREFWDLPGSLFQAHLQALKGNTKMRQWFASQPVQFSVRCGVGFGVSFLIINLFVPILEQLFPLRNLGATTPETSLVYIFAWLSAVDIVCCLILGIAMAVAFGEIRHPQRFLLLAAIWVIFPNIIDLFMRWLSAEWYQLPANTPIYNIVYFALTGAYLGVVINPWPKDQRKTLQFIIAGAVGLPLARKIPQWLLYGLLHLPATPLDLSWRMIVSSAVYWAIVGLVIGAALGALSRWSKPPQNSEILA